MPCVRAAGARGSEPRQCIAAVFHLPITPTHFTLAATVQDQEAAPFREPGSDLLHASQPWLPDQRVVGGRRIASVRKTKSDHPRTNTPNPPSPHARAGAPHHRSKHRTSPSNGRRPLRPVANPPRLRRRKRRYQSRNGGLQPLHQESRELEASHIHPFRRRIAKKLLARERSTHASHSILPSIRMSDKMGPVVIAPLRPRMWALAAMLLPAHRSPILKER